MLSILAMIWPFRSLSHAAAGGLVGLGIPEHKAKIYKDIIDNDGGFLLGVETSNDNTGKVKDILKGAGGESLSVE